MEDQGPHYRFDQLPNFRDVGSTINIYTKASTLNTGVLYRSARPDESSRADRAYLTQTLGIKTIMDLRSKTEHIAAAKKHASSAASPVYGSATVSQCNSSASSALQIPGIRYAEISLTGGAFERALLWQLKYTSLVRFLWLIACGYRKDAVRVLGQEVLLSRGLIGLAIDTLQYSTSEIREIFNILAEEESYPLLMHCTQGKDRTGIVVLLLLMLCGVEDEAIANDYMRSEKELLVEKEEILPAILEIGLSEEFAGCPEHFATEVKKHVQERYGGVEKYLTRIGIDGEVQQRIRRIMLRDPA